ncbi:secretin receptor-like isoform X1 [Acipenser ruthenus]|uniref:secretin receptor-like isoform X1 n=1 Tax=Acipenser ruthenus TaxID=7906 RepID=UPI0027419C3D|nr:secretin receptor-like isoform X1 [Acipenser ruthenus]
MWVFVFLVCLEFSIPVKAIPKECELQSILMREEEHCNEFLSLEKQNLSEVGLPQTECQGMWDNLSCWPSSAIGKTVAVACPKFIFAITGKEGFVYRNCTSDGWSNSFPRHDVACGLDINNTIEDDKNTYYMNVKTMYTVGYGTSLVSLSIAIVIYCSFRKLHCTRNSIHIQLFMSFILRAVSVFAKDRVLFATEYIYHCNAYSAGCKFVMIFFQYCIIANYSWLLVEGLYLHTLLTVSFFSENKYFWCYIALGWGSPLIIITAWSISRHLHEDMGCWDTNSNVGIWWIIKGPVIISIFINVLFFVSIIRILVSKLKTPDARGKEFNHYKRLAKSTLLLIPLFGVHYILFAFFPDDKSSLTMEIRIFFELALGSFQGFVVAVLYCFLNSEVQCEIKRKWRRWKLKKHFKRESRHSRNSTSTGGNGSTQVSLLTREQIPVCVLPLGYETTQATQGKNSTAAVSMDSEEP